MQYALCLKSEGTTEGREGATERRERATEGRANLQLDPQKSVAEGRAHWRGATSYGSDTSNRTSSR